MEEEGRTKGWMFQNREGYWMNISDTEKGFQQGLMRVQLEEVGLIPEGLEVTKDMSLRIPLRRILSTEVLNNGLES